MTATLAGQTRALANGVRHIALATAPAREVSETAEIMPDRLVVAAAGGNERTRPGRSG